MMNLFIFDHISGDEVISALLRFKDTREEADYCIAARGLIKFSPCRLAEGDILKEYVIRRMLDAPLPDISKLRDFLRHDVKLIYNLILDYDWNGLIKDCGFIPFDSIEIAPCADASPEYTASIRSMLQCKSNEALGGAILAHAESFAGEK